MLAVYALNLSRISVMDTATLLFGYFLAEKLEPPSLFWGFIATLVAAVYYGYGKLPRTDQIFVVLHCLSHASHSAVLMWLLVCTGQPASASSFLWEPYPQLYLCCGDVCLESILHPSGLPGMPGKAGSSVTFLWPPTSVPV